ncbi:MAG: LptA/OstA family protein [Bacillota bacterium]
MKKWWFLVLFFIISAGLVKAANEPVKATGDKIWGDDKKKLTFLEGNVRIIQGSTMITTEKTRVDMDKKIASFGSGVKLSRPDLTIAADNLEYNFKKKSGSFTRNVLLNRSEVKDKEGKVTKDAFTLITEELYFEADTDNFLAKNRSQVEHREFTGSADLIAYDDRKQELCFTGNAYLKRPNGEEIRGAEIIINTQANSFAVKRQVELKNDEVTITANHLEYDYQKKNGTFSGNVILDRAETKDEHGKIVKEGFKLTSAKLYFESETKNFKTEDKGMVEHRDFTGSAVEIEYIDSKQVLTFKTNAFLKRPKEEEIRGNLITIYIKDKSFVVNQGVSIEFRVDSEKGAQENQDRKAKRK